MSSNKDHLWREALAKARGSLPLAQTARQAVRRVNRYEVLSQASPNPYTRLIAAAEAKRNRPGQGRIAASDPPVRAALRSFARDKGNAERNANLSQAISSFDWSAQRNSINRPVKGQAVSEMHQARALRNSMLGSSLSDARALRTRHGRAMLSAINNMSNKELNSLSRNWDPLGNMRAGRKNSPHEVMTHLEELIYGGRKPAPAPQPKPSRKRSVMRETEAFAAKRPSRLDKARNSLPFPTTNDPNPTRGRGRVPVQNSDIRRATKLKALKALFEGNKSGAEGANGALRGRGRAPLQDSQVIREGAFHPNGALRGRGRYTSKPLSMFDKSRQR